jgi:DNA primase
MSRPRLSARPAFDRDRLPRPADYFDAAGIKLSAAGAWRNALCPFHEDHHPSLRIRIETGAFRCMACGASGGDVLAFHMRRHGLTFIDAAKALGAWEDWR